MSKLVISETAGGVAETAAAVFDIPAVSYIDTKMCLNAENINFNAQIWSKFQNGSFQKQQVVLQKQQLLFLTYLLFLTVTQKCVLMLKISILMLKYGPNFKMGHFRNSR